MRLQHAVITLAVLAVTMVAFIGAMRVSPAEPREAVVPVAVTRAAVPQVQMRDQTAMLLVGTALIGLAAAVRRAA
jgi:uncharacterized protein with FMN-binding domain